MFRVDIFTRDHVFFLTNYIPGGFLVDTLILAGQFLVELPRWILEESGELPADLLWSGLWPSRRWLLNRLARRTPSHAWCITWCHGAGVEETEKLFFGSSGKKHAIWNRTDIRVYISLLLLLLLLLLSLLLLLLLLYIITITITIIIIYNYYYYYYYIITIIIITIIITITIIIIIIIITIIII